MKVISNTGHYNVFFGCTFNSKNRRLFLFMSVIILTLIILLGSPPPPAELTLALIIVVLGSSVLLALLWMSSTQLKIKKMKYFSVFCHSGRHVYELNKTYVVAFAELSTASKVSAELSEVCFTSASVSKDNDERYSPNS